MLYLRNITLLFCLLFSPSPAIAASDTFRIHTDYPYVNKEDKLLLNVYYSADSLFKADLKVWFYLFQGNDSTCVLFKHDQKAVFKKGVNKCKLNCSTPDSNTSYNAKFYEILKRTNDLPSGNYKVVIQVSDSPHSYTNKYIHELDSTLGPRSEIRRDINKTLTGKHKKLSAITSRSIAKHQQLTTAGVVSNKGRKIDRIAKRHGLSVRKTDLDDKINVDFYYDDWFVGRYEASKSKAASDQAEEDDKADNSDKSVETTNFDHPSLYSQYQKGNRQKNKKDPVKGEIGVSSTNSTGQEPNSGLDNNYYELRGRVQMPVKDIPILMEGYYTSQDNHREIKSSYFHCHYDVEKMKDELGSSMKSYNTKFSESKSKSAGMKSIYQSAIGRLEGQKSSLQNEIRTDELKGADKNNGSKKLNKNQLNSVKKAKNDLSPDDEDDDELADSTDVKNDSIAAERKEKRERKMKAAAEDKKKTEDKKKQVEELDKKIERYKTLIDQNENTRYFDSSLAYGKTRNLGNTHDMSYKQMAKSGVNLLPDGKAKTFLAGVTTMDAGMFSKSESKYTMGGQMMKGLDFGYDLGFCETGVTVGKTEYVGRDGGLDKYTFYSGKVSCKPVKEQKVSFVYYGYTPDRKITTHNDFFDKQNISAPGFFQRVHILSTNYTGSISEYVHVAAEAATSMKESDNANSKGYAMKDKMAYEITAEGYIPNTSVNLEAEYSKTGKGFENNTLPLLLSGTEQYRFSGRNDFFRSFLTVGVEFNKLIQSSFSMKGSNTKWGFDVKTNSKRYPNLAASYKPFATFRSFNDTFSIPQKPLFGSVWTGKATYQLKRHQRSYRFGLLYNNCLTVMDTAQYSSKLMQASGIYAHKGLTTTVIIGRSEVSGATPALKTTAPNKMSFLTVNASYSFSKSLTVMAGQDLGKAVFGFCRYSPTAGMQYRFKKPDMLLRTNFRFSTFKLTESAVWENIYSGNIDLTYRFKAKEKKNNF